MPDATDNDPWADLYADLGVTEKPARPAPAVHAAPIDEAAADESAEGEEGDDDSDEEGGEGTATADDGTTKKRRRRRRRGKKKPGDEAAGAEGATGDGPDENETPEYGRHAAQPAPTRQPAASAPAGDFESDIDSDGDDAAAPAEVSAEAERPLEGATTEMTRELIANWNVPSWEELVTGLHRPSH